MKEKLRDILENPRFVAYESTTELQFIGYLVREYDLTLAVYGAGDRGLIALKWLEMQGLNAAFVIDQDEKKQGRSLGGVPILSLEEAEKRAEHTELFVVLATTAWDNPFEKSRISAFLARAGVTRYMDIFQPNLEFGYADHYRCSFYHNHREELLRVFDCFHDEESRRVFCEYLRIFMQFDRYSLPVRGMNEKYFDSELFVRRDDEVYLNCGSYTGDTVVHFLENYGDGFAQIHAFEADAKICERLRYNLAMLPERAQRSITVHNLKLGAENPLDNMAHVSPTLISMDIEGAELEALRGCRKTIGRVRPVLAVCAYHTPMDLIDLPEFMASLSGYRLFLRKYLPGAKPADWIWQYSELVLYAVPEERCKL